MPLPSSRSSKAGQVRPLCTRYLASLSNLESRSVGLLNQPPPAAPLSSNREGKARPALHGISDAYRLVMQSGRWGPLNFPTGANAGGRRRENPDADKLIAYLLIPTGNCRQVVITLLI